MFNCSAGKSHTQKKKKDGKQAGRRIHCHTEKIKIKIEKKKRVLCLEINDSKTDTFLISLPCSLLYEGVAKKQNNNNSNCSSKSGEKRASPCDRGIKPNCPKGKERK